jgi:hypothetical protein
MINPEKFRIGNKFKWNSLASMGIGVDIITKENHYSHNQLKDPIILEENDLIDEYGFKQDGNRYYKDDFNVYYDDEKFYVMLSERKIILSYVHQLQNIYSFWDI